MPTFISEQTRSIVSACVPALEAHGLDITHEMYKRLLSHSEIRNLFNISHQKDGEQPKALAFAVLAYARHINNPAPLQKMIERIAEKHVGLNIEPQHYPFVGEALLGAIAHVLGDDATPEIMDAWKEAYWFLADVLIEREKTIYSEHKSQEGGWVGWRSFYIAERHTESSSCTSFILRPVDKKPIMKHKPGQYLSFYFDIDKKGSERRNYSISSAPSHDHYRITVKRQNKGIVSNWLHDNAQKNTILKVSAPAGEFYFHTGKQRPITLISLGVGVTPMISIIENHALLSEKKPIHYIHGARDYKDDLFIKKIHDMAHKNILKADLFYSKQASSLTEKNITIHNERITTEWLTKYTNHQSDFYICGPIAFMKDTIKAFHEAGISEEHIHYDIFGSASDPFFATNS